MFWYTSKDNKEQEVDEDTSIEEEHGQTALVLPEHQHGKTLLPAPAAALVSGATGLTSFWVRAGTKIGGWGLYAGREATLKTLSVSRSVLETVLIAAGRDVATRSSGDLGKAEAENLLERSVCILPRIVVVTLIQSRYLRYTRPSQPYRSWHRPVST
jgi:hypothetical protein